MTYMFSFIFWGRGGEGVKTCAEVLARAAFDQGLEVQAFPEYGPERSGAPVKTFLKISEKPIKEQAPIENADYVVVLDSSLLQTSLRESILSQKNAVYLINAKSDLGIKNSKTIDASSIAIKHLGKDLSNVVLAGALVKLVKFIELESLESAVKKVLANKPELIAQNIKALKEAYSLIK